LLSSHTRSRRHMLFKFGLLVISLAWTRAFTVE
jgi:hypothetical protein